MAKEAALTPAQRQARAKDQSQNQAVGCLAILVVIVVVVIAAIFWPKAGGAADAILRKIPGCTDISTSGGNSLDDNTVAEGDCTLSDGTSLSIYVWADSIDQHDYLYWNSNLCTSNYPPPDNAPDGCVIGNSPQPWFIDVSTSNESLSYAQGEWAKVANPLNGSLVAKIPASWCNQNCPIPGLPATLGGTG